MTRVHTRSDVGVADALSYSLSLQTVSDSHTRSLFAVAGERSYLLRTFTEKGTDPVVNVQVQFFRIRLLRMSTMDCIHGRLKA